MTDLRTRRTHGAGDALLRWMAPALLCASTAAHSQVIDDIDVRRDGATTVVQVRFVPLVQFRRGVPSRSGDLTQAFYDVIGVTGADVQRLFGPGDRRVLNIPGLPQLVINDEPVSNAGLGRKLVFRLATPVRMSVRAGRGGRSIELVLDAAADVAAVSAPPAPARPTPAPTPTPTPSTVPTPTPPAAPSVARPTAPATAAAPPPSPAPAIPPTRPPVPAPAVAGVPTPAPTPAAVPDGSAAAADDTGKAAALLAKAKAATARDEFAVALEALNDLLAMPPTASSREAQELIGQLRLKVGDFVQGRAELETFLKLYPTGADSDRVRATLAGLPQAAAPATAAAAAVPEASSSLSGTISQFYYGGQSKVRTQEFQDSPLSGLPQLATESTLSGTDQKQSATNVDLNWRYRDSDQDVRAVFRDGYTANLMPNGVNKNRLTALYVDYRSLRLGTQVRLGRQSATGGGVLGRFDGVQASYVFRPKWRLNAVAGVPTDKLLDSKRRFYGTWIDADAITQNISGSLYIIQQTVDGTVDRRGLGTELRYFNGGISLSSMLDYDLVLRGLNIASLQGTWSQADTTTVNALYDRRATPMLMLGNALFFQPTRFDANDPNVILQPARRLKELLDTTTLEALRQQVKATNSYTTQALLGITRPLGKNWQAGADIRFTDLGAIAPVPEILPLGQGRSRNRSVGAQLIGTNLYSSRDTHVLSLSLLNGSAALPLGNGAFRDFTYTGRLLAYNNATVLNEWWQLEPSLKYYLQSDSDGVRTTRWSPGLRVTWRATKRFSIESEVNAEISKTTSPANASAGDRTQNANRLYYYLGGRYDL